MTDDFWTSGWPPRFPKVSKWLPVQDLFKSLIKTAKLTWKIRKNDVTEFDSGIEMISVDESMCLGKNQAIKIFVNAAPNLVQFHGIFWYILLFLKNQYSIIYVVFLWNYLWINFFVKSIINDHNFFAEKYLCISKYHLFFRYDPHF